MKVKIRMKPSGRTVGLEDVKRYGDRLIARLKKRDRDYIDGELRRMGIADPTYFRDRWGDESFRLKSFPSKDLVECIPIVNGSEIVTVGFALPPYLFEMFNEDQDGV